MMRTNLVKISQKIGFVLLLTVLGLASCSDEPRKKVNIEEVSAEVKLRRFDEDFFSMREATLQEDLSALKAKYPNFYPFYQQDIMQWAEEEELENCRLLISDTNVAKLRDTIGQLFGDFSEQMAILNPAFKRFHYHFPEAALPEIVIAYTEFLFRSGTDSAALVLPLEMYLGESYPVYAFFNIPTYMLRRMNKEHLPAVAMTAWLDQTFGTLPAGRRFIDQMIKEGKQLYYLQNVLPDMHDSLITGWSGDQLNWLKENEFQMWTYYINDEYLYSNDGAMFMPLLTDGPFTAAPNIPPGSAPRIGAYSGWQIVKKYMEANPDLSLLDLMTEMDSDKILRESGYRP